MMSDERGDFMTEQEKKDYVNRPEGQRFTLEEFKKIIAKLRAEDGRSIRNVDISMFINDLPNKKDTRCFSTEDASGSTSQAAAVIEGIESGSRVFLIDEDTSATNFMVRDDLMQRVINRSQEPITPFTNRAEDLFHKEPIFILQIPLSRWTPMSPWILQKR